MGKGENENPIEMEEDFPEELQHVTFIMYKFSRSYVVRVQLNNVYVHVFLCHFLDGVIRSRSILL